MFPVDIPDFKEYGVISFDYHGNRQVVPNYAVPKINSALLSGIYAKNNSLVLRNQSYYSWTTSNGGRFAWTVNNGRIGWAASESLLAENTNQKGTNYKWEMRKASNILTALAQGKSLYGYWIEAGYQEGDTFTVYGKKYAIDSSGHINVSTEEEFTSTEIVYPSRET